MIKKHPRPLNKVCALAWQIITDTLRKRSDDGVVRWDWAKLTMLASFVIANFMALWDFFKSGFRFDVFVTYISLATGAKITAAIAKKLKPNTPSYEPNESTELH